MRIVIHHDIPDDPLLHQQWNALVQEMEHPEVFYTYEWAFAVACAYRESLATWLVLTYDGDELTGVAALAADREKRSATFLTSATADYCDLVGSPKDRGDFLRTLFSECVGNGLDTIIFANLPNESATTAVLASIARECGFRTFVRPAYLCAQVSLRSDKDRVDLRSLPQTNKKLRRNFRDLAKRGEVHLDHLSAWCEIEPVLEEFMIAHVARFLATARISNLASPQRRSFLSELARLLSSSGWVVLTRLTVGGRAIAWNYGLRFGKSWFWYLPTFDTRFEQQSPGYCLLAKIVSQACDASEVQVVDLGLGDEGYKNRIANDVRGTVHATITRSVLKHIERRVRFHIAEAVKSSPIVETAVRATISKIHRIRGTVRRGGYPRLFAAGAHRVAHLLHNERQVVFYQWPATTPSWIPLSWEPVSIQPLSLEVLAVALLHFQTDEDTRAYLLRSAVRFRSEEGRGFVLRERDGVPVHFCWSKEFQAFQMMEMGLKLTAPTKNAVLIFDCWTPVAKRGRGYYSKAIAAVARTLALESKQAWIYSASTNGASIRGIEDAGFQRGYSIIRTKTLNWSHVETKAISSHTSLVEEEVGP